MLSTVLIIDKRAELPYKYKKCIDGSDFRAVIAQNMKDGFEKIQYMEPDMIIISDSIDEPLPYFCRKIRDLTFDTRPIIIALSKSADISDRIEALESGADDFLSEPVNTEEFKSRIKAHLRRDIESDLDTKTLLPSLKYSKKAMKRALVEDNKAVLEISIENLKEYASVYTELAADKLVQTFIAIAKSALDAEDFIGHINETTFIIVTNKYSAEKLAEFLTFAFDTVVPKFYSEKDVNRGYMLIDGDKHAGMRVNFVSILIGGVVDGFENLKNINLLLERLYEVKNFAKVTSGSNYAIERAKLSGKNAVLSDIPNKKVYIKESDASLAYLIRMALELQGYDVTESITDIPSVIIADSGDTLDGLNFCREIKQNLNYSGIKLIVTSTVQDKESILAAGADLYLPKPYEISDLIHWVEYFMKR